MEFAQDREGPGRLARLLAQLLDVLEQVGGVGRDQGRGAEGVLEAARGDERVHVGRADEGHALALRDLGGHDGGRALVGAGDGDRAAPHHLLGLGAGHLRLGFGVGDDVLELGAAHRLDATLLVDEVAAELEGAPGALAPGRVGAGERHDRGEQDLLGLGGREAGRDGGGGRHRGRREEFASGGRGHGRVLL